MRKKVDGGANIIGEDREKTRPRTACCSPKLFSLQALLSLTTATPAPPSPYPPSPATAALVEGTDGSSTTRPTMAQKWTGRGRGRKCRRRLREQSIGCAGEEESGDREEDGTRERKKRTMWGRREWTGRGRGRGMKRRRRPRGGGGDGEEIGRGRRERCVDVGLEAA